MSPPDNKIWEYHEKDVSNAKTYSRKLNVVSLADKADDKKPSDEEAIIDVVKYVIFTRLLKGDFQLRNL